MYSIINVIYGIPVTESLAQRFDEGELENMGFEILYHGGLHYSPGYIGVELCNFCGFDNPSIDKLTLKPTYEQRLEVKEKLEQLDTEVVGGQELNVYFIESTS